jgi:hypothetical protein
MVNVGASLRDARLFTAPTDRGLKPTATIGASLRDAGQAQRLPRPVRTLCRGRTPPTAER